MCAAGWTVIWPLGMFLPKVISLGRIRALWLLRGILGTVEGTKGEHRRYI